MSRTYSQVFESALKCETKKQADRWIIEEMAYHVRQFGQNPDEARHIILSNLGYMAGYYDHETAQKINRLFGAVHPVFGTASYHKELTPADAFQMAEKK